MSGTRIFQDLPTLANIMEIKHPLPQEGTQMNVEALSLNVNSELGDSDLVQAECALLVHQ